MAITTLDMNQDFYVPIIDHGKYGISLTETDLARCSKAETLDDLVTQQHDNVIAVIKLNPHTHNCRDASVEFADLWWSAIFGRTRRYVDVPEFIKHHHPHADIIEDVLSFYEVA